MKKFKEFLEENESGRFLVNPYWLEHLLNLFYQEYYGGVWEEMQTTQINMLKFIENLGYGIIGKEFNRGNDK